VDILVAMPLPDTVLGVATLVQQCLQCLDELAEYAPLHWTTIEISDYVQSVPERFWLDHLQHRVHKLLSTAFLSEAATQMTLAPSRSVRCIAGQKLLLQFRRIVASNHGLRIRTRVVDWAILALLQQLGEICLSPECIKLDRSSVALVFRLCGIQFYPFPEGVGHVGAATDDCGDYDDTGTLQLLIVYAITSHFTSANMDSEK
jgi:hypothetical protein